MYDGPIIDTHMHLWDLANGYAWLSNADPAFEHLRRNFLAPDYAALTHGYTVLRLWISTRDLSGSFFPSLPGEQALFHDTAQRGYRL